MVKDYGPMIRCTILFGSLCCGDLQYNKAVCLSYDSGQCAKDFSTQRP